MKVNQSALFNFCLQQQDVGTADLFQSAIIVLRGQSQCNSLNFCRSQKFASISAFRRPSLQNKQSLHDFFSPPKQHYTPFAFISALNASELFVQKPVVLDKKQKSEWLNDKELKQIFNDIDQNGDGNIQIEEMQIALKSVGLPSGREYINDLFRQYDKNRDEIISWDEFKSYVRSKQEAILEAFQNLDTSDTGEISESDILKSLKLSGLPAHPSDARRMIQLLDADNNHSISSNEFAKYMCMLPAAQLRNRNELFVWVDAADFVQGMENRLSMCPSRMTYQRLMTGGIAGALSRTIVAPFERLRTIIMVNQGTSLIKGVRLMWSDGGFMGMFKGNLPTVIKVIPQTAVQFALYDGVKDLFTAIKRDQLNVGEKLMAGCIAGAGAGTVSYPFDTLRTLLCMPGQNKSFIQIAIDLVQRQGIGGLYRGFGTSLISDTIATGAGFMCYDIGNRVWAEQFGCAPSAGEKGIIGGISGIIVMTCTMPLEVVMRRLQAQGAPGAVHIYNGMFDAFRKMAAQEGWRTFFRGSFSSYLKVAPSIGAMYFFYDFIAKNWAIEGIRRYKREKSTVQIA